MKKIIFTLEPGDENISKDYYPVPGVKAIPDWYKNMETSFAQDKTNHREVRESQTMKRCLPIIDSMTNGYILKTHTDLYAKYENHELIIEWAEDPKKAISFHGAYQMMNYKNLDLWQGAPKIRNPWGIKTPKGYSCLFISPLHHPATGITILPGVVDTDKYSVPVQFPFLFDPNFAGVIPAGTPIVQAIPFKRDSFRMEMGGDKEREEMTYSIKNVHATWINGYRNKYRVGKDYL